jgi:hypothetical protein
MIAEDSAMRRFLWLWLTLLGAWWAAATLVSAALYQRVPEGLDAVFRPLLVTLLQAAVLWWVTRERSDRSDRSV